MAAMSKRSIGRLGGPRADCKPGSVSRFRDGDHLSGARLTPRL